MATESLQPMLPQGRDQDVDIGALLSQDPNLQDENFLSELLASEGDDFLSALLEPTPHYQMLSPQTNPTDFIPVTFDLDAPLLLLPQPSPTTSDGYASDTNTFNKLHSPTSYSSGSDHLGDSPYHSPSMPVVSSSLPDHGGDLSAFLGLGEPVTSTALSPPANDVKIDVDLMRQDSSSSSSDLKAVTLVLTEEEKKMLEEEGVALPTDMPLTKAEQKHLKRIRRKIKNKISAQESRKRKKEYVEGLEHRVEKCTMKNRDLLKKVNSLESENLSLLAQLRKLQAMVTQYNPSRLQAGTLVMVFVLSFSLFFVPGLRTRSHTGAYQIATVHSRSLLFTETDEFGNVIDAESGRVISQAGGLSPIPPPPWTFQTPAFNLFNRSFFFQRRNEEVDSTVPPQDDSDSVEHLRHNTRHDL